MPEMYRKLAGRIWSSGGRGMTEKDCIRDVIGYEGLYTVNVLGEIYSVKSKKKLSPCVNRFGYMNVCLYKNGKQKTEKVHRIVASAFIPNPLNKTQVNHIDGNKKINLAMSSGLRALHDEGIIQLSHKLDSGDMWFLYEAELHPIKSTVTHVTVRR